MFSSDDEWQWWLKMKVNRCHLWRTKHCPEIELQQLWILDTTLKWMCYYLHFNLKKWNFKFDSLKGHQHSVSAVSSTPSSCLCAVPEWAFIWGRDLPGWPCHHFGLGPSQPRCRRGMSETANSCMLRRPRHCRDAGASVLFTLILAWTLPSCGFFPFWFLTFLALHRCSR